MPFLIKSLIALPLFYFTAGHNFSKLWKGGLIGIFIVAATDYMGYKFNLYSYQNALVMLWGFMPILNNFSLFLVSMMYLNWLPHTWPRRIMYTAYISIIFLAVEAAMFANNAIVYIRWQLWYSYFLLIAGLLLLAFLWDLVKKPIQQNF